LIVITPLQLLACRFVLAHRHFLILFNNMATTQQQQLELAYEKYRYEALFGAWLLVTGVTFRRIRRQPYSMRLKVEQYESIFKGTSLGAIVLGIGMAPKRGLRRVA